MPCGAFSITRTFAFGIVVAIARAFASGVRASILPETNRAGTSEWSGARKSSGKRGSDAPSQRSGNGKSMTPPTSAVTLSRRMRASRSGSLFQVKAAGAAIRSLGDQSAQLLSASRTR